MWIVGGAWCCQFSDSAEVRVWLGERLEYTCYTGDKIEGVVSGRAVTVASSLTDGKERARVQFIL